MTALATNGHVPGVQALPLDDVVDGQLHDPIEAAEKAMQFRIRDFAHGLREELTRASNQRMDLERLLAVAKNNERRLAKAIMSLEGETDAPKPSTSSTPAKSKSKNKATGKAEKWNVSDATVERVWNAFLRYSQLMNGEPFTMTTLARWMGEQGEGIGGETVRRAVDRLRDTERVRKCGTTRGGGLLWAPMPGAEHAA